jgi:hypothetical protein
VSKSPVQYKVGKGDVPPHVPKATLAPVTSSTMDAKFQPSPSDWQTPAAVLHVVPEETVA